MNSGIYKITNIANGKVMIGQSVDIKHRWRAYRSELKKNKYPNLHLQRAWNKYGESSFRFEVICECPKRKLDEEEIRFIQEYNSTNREYGYNIEPGGNFGKQCSEETKQKMSKSWDYDKHFTQETRNKISESNTGMPCSENCKKATSLANTGKHRSEEQKQKLRENHLGKKLSEETKQKISRAMSGENNPNFGKPQLFNPMLGKRHSEESKQKMSRAKTGKKLCLSEEARQRRKERVAGKNNPFFGKCHSEETRRKMKEAWQRRKQSAKQEPVSSG